MTRRRLILLFMVWFISASCVGCATPVSPTARPTLPPAPTLAPTATRTPNRDLRVGVRADVHLLNPYLGFNDTEKLCIESIYETLLTADVATGVGPGLADSFEWDPGNAGATFHLNPDARWSDGQPVTADDVVFSFGFVRQQQLPIYFSIARSFGGVEKVDDHTVHLSSTGHRLMGRALSAPRSASCHSTSGRT